MPPFDDPDGILQPRSPQNRDALAERVWTVSQLNRFVRGVIEGAAESLWVRGEVSNLTIHRSGHVYFSLKDDRSQVSAVYFRGAADARRLRLTEGGEVEVQGRLSLYEPRGQYQVIADRIRVGGEGELRRRFEELKAKLRAEGLFDPDRKRPLPTLPRTVGVVTSPQGAAMRDFLQVVSRRFATLHVRIVPAAVQGQQAVGEVIRGIELLNAADACDVIVVTRGGGSLEDLWSFNDERLVCAVASSRIPVLSAVGHETDTTLCDLTADARAPTPSAGAELVIGTTVELRDRIHALRNRLRGRMALRLQELENRVQRAARHAVFREPGHLLRTCQQRIDDLEGRARAAMQRCVDRDEARLERQKSALQALDPSRVLRRGYAILTREGSAETITDSGQVDIDEAVNAQLARGRLRLTVCEKTEE